MKHTRYSPILCSRQFACDISREHMYCGAVGIRSQALRHTALMTSLCLQRRSSQASNSSSAGRVYFRHTHLEESELCTAYACTCCIRMHSLSTFNSRTLFLHSYGSSYNLSSGRSIPPSPLARVLRTCPQPPKLPQCIRTFMLARVTPRALSALPGVFMVMPTKKGGGKDGGGGKAETDPELAGSNVLSVGEGVLLKWLSYHLEQANRVNMQ